WSLHRGVDFILFGLDVSFIVGCSLYRRGIRVGGGGDARSDRLHGGIGDQYGAHLWDYHCDIDFWKSGDDEYRLLYGCRGGLGCSFSLPLFEEKMEPPKSQPHSG